MSYFDRESNVHEYINMCEGFDGKEIIEKLKKYLSPPSTILELGMGPGKDMDILLDDYDVTGSDSSQVFLDLYKEQNPNAKLLKLDAVSIQTDLKFDCIYSNKVLHHLSKSELQKSLTRQLEILNKEGVAIHTFWHGDKEEKMDDLLFVYYKIPDLAKMIPIGFEIIATETYKEFEQDDSIFLVIKRV